MKLIPPEKLIIDNAVGTFDYENVVKAFVDIGKGITDQFIQQGFVYPKSRVLDMGCGLGRLAWPLTEFLTEGSYDGVDVVKSSIAWCKENYSEYDNFRFHHANLFSTFYNPKAKQKAVDYKFPFDDKAFDFQWSTSVFTHMMLDEVDNYLSEISRTLRKNARCWNTIYLLDEDAENLQAAPEPKRMHLAYQIDSGRLIDEKVPEKLIAFRQRLITDLYKKNGLRIEDIRYGPWSGRDYNIRSGFQDTIIARKI